VTIESRYLNHVWEDCLPRPARTEEETNVPPTDYPAEIQAIERPQAGAAERVRSGVDSPPADRTAPARQRSVSIQDPQFPSGRVDVVAWDVVCDGDSDLSTMLCCRTDGDYFLRCRSGDQPDVAPRIIPLSEAQAAGWFDQLPVHFTHRDARWQ